MGAPLPERPELVASSDAAELDGGVPSAGVPTHPNPVLQAASFERPGDPGSAAGFFDEDDEFDDDEEQTRVAPGLEELSALGGLAGAFQQVVASPAASALEALNMPADDWYVGINGVPAGPMRLNELRSKAASGAVDAESLVWREGFEDWKPLRSFPELFAIIEDVVPRPSEVNATPSGVAPVGQVGDPFAPSESSRSSALDLEAAGIPRRAGPSPAAWLAIVAAMGLGFTVSYVVFSSPPEKETIYVEVERPGQAAAPTVQQPASTAPEPGEEPASETAAPKAGGRRNSGTTIPVKGGGPEEKKSGGLKGLEGLKGVAGPSGPSGDTAPRQGGQPLDSAQVQRTVSRYTASVKRSCWQPALDTRDKNAPSSARVSVTIKVAPSGSVQGVSTSGDPAGYQGLSRCIAARVRGWQFPASSGTTTVNVPFVFAAQ